MLINPGAGSGEVTGLRAVLEFALVKHGWHYEMALLEKGVHISSVVQQLVHAGNTGASLVIACGGDGTISLVASAIIKAGLASRLTLGAFPSGTANSLARDLGVPSDWSAAADFLCTQSPVVQLDAMKMGERYCFLRIGVGLDAATIHETSREDKKHLGRWAYVKSFLSRLFHPQRIRFTCHIDGRRRRFWAVQLFIANGGNIALVPFRIGPDIKWNDGVLNICAYDALYWWDYLTLGWKLFRKNYHAHPLLKFYVSTRQIRVQCKPVAMVQADGESFATTPIHIEVIPQAVQVLSQQ